jgi:hypothetical protein
VCSKGWSIREDLIVSLVLNKIPPISRAWHLMFDVWRLKKVTETFSSSSESEVNVNNGGQSRALLFIQKWQIADYKIWFPIIWLFWSSSNWIRSMKLCINLMSVYFIYNRIPIQKDVRCTPQRKFSLAPNFHIFFTTFSQSDRKSIDLSVYACLTTFSYGLTFFV